MPQDSDQKEPMLSRRNALAATGLCFAMLSQRTLAAEGMTSTSSAMPLPVGARPTFTKDDESAMREVKAIHHGKGTTRTKWFRFANTPWPAHFMVYDLPPGASEGVHTHFLDDRNKEGAYDEYYYIISGQGQMEIDGAVVPVKMGDHIHTPLEVAHGVENTHATENLRVFLTFVQRAGEPYPL